MPSGKDWDEVRGGWASYREAVDAWLEAASAPASEPPVVDELTHRLISRHDEWSEQLGAIVQETHQH